MLNEGALGEEYLSATLKFAVNGMATCWFP
jgi:hypothetical protein